MKISAEDFDIKELKYNGQVLLSMFLIDNEGDPFIKTQYTEGTWLTRCIVEEEDEYDGVRPVITQTDLPSDDSLLRNIHTEHALMFRFKAQGIYSFHEGYKIRNFRCPSLCVTTPEGNCLLLAVYGEATIDRYGHKLTIYPGECSIAVACAKDPAKCIKKVYKLLTQKPSCSDPVKGVPDIIRNSVYTAVSQLSAEHNEPFPIPCGLTRFSILRLMGKLGMETDMTIPAFDMLTIDPNYKKEIIGGMLPFRKQTECEPFDGSSLDTLLFIKAVSQLTDPGEDLCKAANLARSKFTENFIKDGNFLINTKRRTELCRMPRFLKGKCLYCQSGEPLWLEKTKYSTYACNDCMHRANDPDSIPDRKEYTSPLPLLMAIYLDMEPIPNIKDKLEEYFHHISDPVLLALLLYAACKYDIPSKDKIYSNLISKRNGLGIWHSDTPCCALTNALSAEAVLEYQNS